MEFITAKGNGEYVVNEQTLQYVQNCQSPIAVIAVAGVYRAGKSTLLNKLMGKVCFSTSKTTKSQTKGLWIAEWRPGVYLIDAEGMGSTETTEQHDFNIFALAVLLSSTIIYNNDGPITSQALQALKVAAKVADLLKNQTKLKLSQTSLLWLIRNAELQMVDDGGREIDAPTYLEHSIAGQRGLLELFANRTCMTVRSPTEAEKHDVFSGDGDFSRDLDAVSRYLQANVHPRQANGFEINGPTFGCLVQAVVKSLNAGKGLNLMPVYDACLQMQNEKARRAAKQRLRFDDPLAVLVDMMKQYESLVMEPRDITVLHELSGLVQATNAQGFQRWLESGTLAVEKLPDFIRAYVQPVVDALAQRHGAVASELKSALQRTQAELAESRAQLAAAVEARDARDASVAKQLAEANAQVADMQNKVLRTQSSKGALEEELEAVNVQLEECSRQLEAQQATLLTQTNLCASLQRDNKSLTETNSFLSSEVDAQLKVMKSSHASTESKLARKHALLEAATKDLEQAASDLAALKSENTKLSTLMAKLEANRLNLDQLIENLRKENRTLELKIVAFEAREEEAQKHNKRHKPSDSSVAGELKWLKAQHESDTAALANAKEEIAALIRRNMSLEISAMSARVKLEDDA